MRLITMMIALFAFSAPAMAGLEFISIEDRAESINASLEGNHSYHAELAREFANIAEGEKAQHDLGVAKEFMKMAEDEAAKAGGK